MRKLELLLAGLIWIKPQAKILDNYKKFSIIKAGSSLKFCLISEGKADIYI